MGSSMPRSRRERSNARRSDAGDKRNARRSEPSGRGYADARLIQPLPNRVTPTYCRGPIARAPVDACLGLFEEL